MNEQTRAVRESSKPADHLLSAMLIALVAGLTFFFAAGFGIVPLQAVTDFVDRAAHIHD